NGMGKQFGWLAKIFAIFGIMVGLFGIGTFTQINGITSAIGNFFDKESVHYVNLFGRDYSLTIIISGIILTVFVASVLIGGLKRISNVAQIIVPFMAIIYVAVVMIILILNLGKIPAALIEIVQGAFGLRAFGGGMFGAMIVAMQKGIARGIFSNEAGLGSAPIAAAAAQSKEEVRQGLISMLGTFIDTIIICTMTGLSIVITGAWDMGLEGVAVTTKAFQIGLPFPDSVAAFILMVCLVFFAFTTILGWDYYSEKCLEYIIGNKPKAITVYRWIYIACIFIGPYMTVKAVWTIADICNGLMAIPNLIALIALNGVVVRETNSFFERGVHNKI
ncbi:MAG: amino acid carrier protein, partial [Lachnospiraceae bacterium]